ncbi:MAG: transporter substrate-binding domain-containing protein [Parvibaculaceae bacterium]
MTGRAFSTLALTALFALAAAGLAPLGAQDQSAIATPKQEEPPPLPRFRQIDIGGKPASFTRDQITVLADDDFPPFSYAGPADEPQGIAVEAAQAACQELHVKCEIVLKPWQSLAEDGPDGIVAGLRLDDATLAKYQPTRPIYRTLGRFVARKDSDLTQVTRDAVAGKRIGVLAGSGYEAWLKRNFADSVIVPYPSLNELEEALRTAKVELLFGDGLQLVYWMRGSASQNCCKYVDGAYYDDASFSRPYVFFVRRGDEELKQAFDYALDRLQEQGAFTRIFGRYLPARFW